MPTKPLDNPDPAARALAMRRARVPGQCVVCGTAFVGLSDKRYCSRTCETRAYRAKRRAQPPADAPEVEA